MASKKENNKLDKTSDLDTVSSIWILASNDENFLITYEGIKDRLNISDIQYIKELVKLHRELFRLNAPSKALMEWKSQMRMGQRLPSWIRTFPKESEERKNAIDSIKEEDVFRSQFRTKSGTPASNISIINWGLEHIERIRKNAEEKKQEKKKYFITHILPILYFAISFITLFTTFFIQNKTIKSQAKLKQTELEYKTKQDGYTNFMKSAMFAYINSGQGNKNAVYNATDNMEISFYNIEPLMSEKSKNELWNKYQEFLNFCINNIDEPVQPPNFADSCIFYKNTFRKLLQDELFNKK
jgi:hypothetical protein